MLLFGFELSSHEGLAAVSIGLVAFGAAFGVAYLRHARQHPAPIMDFRLMRVASFRTSIIAGSLTRITQGAQPFLLPLMLQLGFGMSAARAGTIVMATAVGSLGMKAFAPQILRRFGFRSSLIVIGLISTCGYATCAAFRPDWPLSVIFVILACCGFFMSFQFTAYNTVAYDEIDHNRMSAATSFYTTFQQLALSLGICIGALVLHGAIALRGHDTPQLSDFSIAFLCVTAISLTATFWNMRFARTAGEEMRGRK
jgi:fucose permease